MAWIRTSLSVAATGTLVAKQAPHIAVSGLLLLTALAAAAGLGATAERRHRDRAVHLADRLPVSAPLPVAVTTAAVVALATAGLAIALW